MKNGGIHDGEFWIFNVMVLDSGVRIRECLLITKDGQSALRGLANFVH